MPASNLSILYPASLLVFTACQSHIKKDAEPLKPNIIYILADDLGYGDLGCYGQEIITTPNIDKLAQQGLLFTQHYSGSTVCAPSRSSLMSGQHTGNTYIRGNRELQPEGQHPMAAEVLTFAEILQDAGYATGAFGKWGLGMADSEGSPNKQGFDEFFGYLCQRYAHRYYPTYLWHNNQQYWLEGNDWTNKAVYAPDVIQEKTLEFIRNHKEGPFFAYIPSLIPHAETIAPEDSILNLYDGKFEETPWGIDNTGNHYQGNDYGAENFVIEGYAPVLNPRASFAAMVTRLDHQVGEIIDLLDELGLTENTLVIFTSDNGPHTEGGADPDFFNSNGIFRGYKRDLYEGGIRVPMLASWPGKIAPNTQTDHPSAFWDVYPTLVEIAGAEIPDHIDGISFLPTLLGEKENQQQHEYLYWEFHERGGRKALRKGDWKLVNYNVFNPENTTVELYNIPNDPGEQNNLASAHPAIVEELTLLMKSERTESELFPFESRIQQPQ